MQFYRRIDICLVFSSYFIFFLFFNFFRRLKTSLNALYNFFFSFLFCYSFTQCRSHTVLKNIKLQFYLWQRNDTNNSTNKRTKKRIKYHLQGYELPFILHFLQFTVASSVFFFKSFFIFFCFFLPTCRNVVAVKIVISKYKN